jgi:hypothetical protein
VLPNPEKSATWGPIMAKKNSPTAMFTVAFSATFLAF